eukprot:6229834-Alexandrium_andersonii.AAC.1
MCIRDRLYMCCYVSNGRWPGGLRAGGAEPTQLRPRAACRTAAQGFGGSPAPLGERGPRALPSPRAALL